MNNQRRKEIRAVAEELDTLIGQLGEIASRLETLRDEEQDYHDNMPESFQQGDKGSKAQEAIDALDSAIDALQGIDAGELTGYLETACE